MTRNYTPRWAHLLTKASWDFDIHQDSKNWKACAVGEALRLSDLGTDFDYTNEEVADALEGLDLDLYRLGNKFAYAIDEGEEEEAKDLLGSINKYVYDNGGRRKLRTAVRRYIRIQRNHKGIKPPFFLI